MLLSIRRILSYKVSVEAMLEFALWLALPYIVIGLAWTFFHPDQVQQIVRHLEKQLPAAADLVAFGLTTLLWPMLVFVGDTCTA